MFDSLPEICTGEIISGSPQNRRGWKVDDMIVSRAGRQATVAGEVASSVLALASRYS